MFVVCACKLLLELKLFSIPGFPRFRLMNGQCDDYDSS